MRKKQREIDRKRLDFYIIDDIYIERNIHIVDHTG